MANAGAVYVGIRGTVVSIDQTTGCTIWSTHIKGGDFVNVTVGPGEIYAATHGELYCLEASTGHVRWRNPLKGYGTGLMTIALAGVRTDQVTPAKRRRDEQAAAAAAAASA